MDKSTSLTVPTPTQTLYKRLYAVYTSVITALLRKMGRRDRRISLKLKDQLV